MVPEGGRGRGDDILQRDHHNIRGAIRYTSRKPERMGEERGREYFLITVHRDRTRTYVAHCEIDDRPSVARDITYTVDATWMPTDCFVRISVGDVFMGTGWFRFSHDRAECETFTRFESRVSQQMHLEEPVRSFQTHAILGDALPLRLYDRKAGGPQDLGQILLCSPDHRGATGPLLHSTTVHVDYLGKELVDVKAGTFEALHFQYVAVPGLLQPHPPYDIWVTNDGEYMFLKGTVYGYMQTHYELTELIRD